MAAESMFQMAQETYNSDVLMYQTNGLFIQAKNRKTNSEKEGEGDSTSEMSLD